MSRIKVYKGNPTAAATDGTLVSDGDNSEPIESGSILVPDEGFTEGNWIKLAVRTDAGFETEDEDTVLPSGTHADASVLPFETETDGSSTGASFDVVDASGFNVGGTIVVDPGEANEETVVITAISDNTLTVDPALSNVHSTETTVVSASNDKWQLAPDSSGSPGTAEDWGDPLAFTSQIIAENTIFWIRARAQAGESPQNNRSVNVRARAVIAASE